MKQAALKTDLVLATTTDVGRKLLGYVVLAILARFLTKADMGELFFAIAIVSIFATFTELGTHRYLVRKVAQDNRHALDHLSAVLSLRLPAIVVSFAALIVVGLVFLPERLAILVLVGLFTLIGDLYYTFAALFLGLRRLGYRLVTGLIDAVLLVIFVLIAVRLGWNLYAVLWCYVVAKITMVLVTASVVRWRFGRFGLVSDTARLREVVRESFPFFVLMFLALVFLKVDTVMLRFIKSVEDVAQYEAAYKFLEVSRFVVRPVGMVFFPLCSQLVAHREWSRFLALFQKLLVGAFGVGAAVAVGVIALASLAVPFVWGPAYETSIPILRVLFLGVPFLYLSFVGTFLAQALHLEKTVIRLMVLSVAANVVLNAAIIPRWGAVGAAWTTVAGEIVLAIGLLGLVAREIRRATREDS